MARRESKQDTSATQSGHWGEEWKKAAESVGIKRPPPGPIPQDDWDDQTDWTSPPPEQAPLPAPPKKQK